MENFVRREVIRSQLEHLASLLSTDGEECCIITACIVDGSSHLFGSSKGVEYIQNYFKGVVEEFLPYLRKTVQFDDVCFHCGDTEVADNEGIKQLKEEFGIVRPICESCQTQGKPVKTRNALKIKKRK